jgi:hypothetical protein
VVRIKRTTTLRGTASLTNGSPVPDGLQFTLTAKWGKRTRVYRAASAGGELSFAIKLPASAKRRKASFALTRAEDTQYLAVKAPVLRARVRSR